MALFILLYIIGIILTALLIRYSDEKLRKSFAKDKSNALTMALILWPLFIVMYCLELCEKLAKGKN